MEGNQGEKDTVGMKANWKAAKWREITAIQSGEGREGEEKEETNR